MQRFCDAARTFRGGLCALVAVLFAILAFQALAAQKTHQPLGEKEIVNLLMNDVAPQRVADLAGQFGISFQVTAAAETKLRHAGATDSLIETLRSIEPKPGAPAEKPATSATQAPVLLIRSAPSGAQVYIDDALVGTTSSDGLLKLNDLQPGEHRVRVGHAGFQDFQKKLALETGRTVTVKAELRAKPQEIAATGPSTGSAATSASKAAFDDGTLDNATARASARGEGAIVGCWLYNGSEVHMLPDGRVTGPLDGARWILDGGNHYTITWPKFLDTLRLSADGKSLNGTDNYGLQVSARRISSQSSGFSGIWQWINGLVVTTSNNGDVVAGPLHGKWVALGADTYKIEWTHFPVDQIVMSADGRTLSGQNQYGGKVGGMRVTCSQ